jgi:hypothetical protein
VKSEFLEHPPKRVAVLPFIVTYPYDRPVSEGIPEAHEVGRLVFRKTFYHAFAPLGYEDVKPSVVDEKLSSWGPVEEGGWQAASPQQLAQALGVDALIYGEISRLIFLSTPLYTETSLDASLRMVDAASGDVLWRQRVQVAERGGALFKKGQVVDFVKDQARSFNPELKFLRVSDMAVTRLLKKLPNPPMSVGTAAGEATVRTGAARLAILPLAFERKGWQKSASTLRLGIASSLEEGPFEIVELQQVDAALRELGWKEGEPLPEDLSISKLADTLGASAVLRGSVTKWGRTYLVLGSWVTAGLRLDLIDASSGEVVWSEQKKNRRHAGILKGPTGFKSIATAPITGLKTSNLERVALHLTREMATHLTTSPAVLAYVNERQPKDPLAR